MSQQTGSQQETVAYALARRVEARRGAASRWAEALRELGAVDRAVYEAVARTPTAQLDTPVRRLSGAADRSRLWLGIPPPAAARPGPGRRGWRPAMSPCPPRRRSPPATPPRRSPSPTPSAAICPPCPC